MIWDTLHTEAYREFGVEYLSPTMASSRFPNSRKRDKEIRRRHEKQDKISAEIKAFEIMSKRDKPPQSMAEAIEIRRQQIVGSSAMIGWILWQIAKPFVIELFKWLWNRLQQEQQLAAGSNRGQ